MSPSLWSVGKKRLLEVSESIPATCRIVGQSSKAGFLPECSDELWSFPDLGDPIFEVSPDDQVAAVWAGADLRQVQEQLKPYGLGLPVPETGHSCLDGMPGSVGGWCAANMPHALSGWYGSPRDSVLGMGIILADGTVAKTGAFVVKSVAGYDIHRFFCGSWGQLGVIGLVFLRLTPLKSIPTPSVTVVEEAVPKAIWVQRVLRSDMERAVSRGRNLIAIDHQSCTLWHSESPVRFDSDWVLPPQGARMAFSAEAKLIERARLAFDKRSRWK